MSDPHLNPRFFDLVGNVRSMRKLKRDPVPDAVLQQVLDAGVQAPSGMNQQPWAFLAVRDPDRKLWFADHYRNAMRTRFPALFELDAKSDPPFVRQARAIHYQLEHMHETPVLLFICGQRDWAFKVAEEDRVGLAPPNYGAVYPCVQNILLACRAVGLGASLTTMHQVFEDELHEYFEIPVEYGVVVTMPIGYPLGNFGAVRRKPAAQSTHLESWGNLASETWPGNAT